MRRCLILLALTGGWLVPPAAAAYFADLSTEALAALIGPVPTADSAGEKAELETMRRVQAGRTAADELWTRRCDEFDAFALFNEGGLLGVDFAEDKRPLLAALLNQCFEDHAPVYALAHRFGRERPFKVDPRIVPCVDTRAQGRYSYPSSHAFRAYFTAAVLAEIQPDARTRLFELARRIADSRVLAGVHFPSDVEAGRQLAAAVVELERHNPAFAAALAGCRREALATGTRLAPSAPAAGHATDG